MKQVAIVCDFDGTITMCDVWDAIWDRFTGTDWRRFNEDYAKGVITYPQLVELCAKEVSFSLDEALEFVRTEMEFRPGFADFMQKCQHLKIPFMLASGGLDFYIKYMMNPWLPDIQMEFNTASFLPSGGLKIDLPFYNPQYCPSCGNCKRRWVEDFQARGYQVVGIGDGATDYCLADSADIVYARSILQEYCQQKGIAFKSFESFNDIDFFTTMGLC